MATIILDIEGIKEVQEILKQLPLKLQKNVTKQINFKAANIAVKIIGDSAPVGKSDKKARERIKSNVRAKGGKGDAVFVGLNKKVFWGNFVSAGTQERFKRNEKKSSTGSIKATEWIPQAHEKAFPAILSFLNENYLKIIESTIQKLSKKLLN